VLIPFSQMLIDAEMTAVSAILFLCAFCTTLDDLKGRLKI